MGGIKESSFANTRADFLFDYLQLGYNEVSGEL